MKTKLKTPDRFVVGFNRREMIVIKNCLNEACHGLLVDRFIPAHEEISKMHERLCEISKPGQAIRVNTMV